MRHLRFPFYVGMVLLAVLAACAPQVLSATAPAPTIQPPANTLVPVPADTPTEAPTLQPVVLAGPPMEVGSMWPYVDGSILVAVPGGPFTMGHGGSDNPEHTVTLSDFWIYQAKVTNQQYALCVRAGKCKTPDPVDDFTFNDATHANDPVVGVNYSQGSDYCTFVHGRLPTEAEWEKTARGPDANIYPWGSNAPICDLLNFNNCVKKITDVTLYPKGQSFYHALDMEGNVFEWVADWYDALYYKNGAAQDPVGPDAGQKRSVRSSSYKSKLDEIPASTRRYSFPTDHRRDLGFRCVVEDPTYFAPLCQAIGVLGAGPTGSSSAGTLETDCPKVGIGLTADCQAGKVTVTMVDDHSPDLNAHVDTGDPGKCSGTVTEHVFPQTYTCTLDTTVTITTACNYVSSAAATCSAHYSLNPSTGMCEWDGTGTVGGQCLPGQTYDPVHQCCTAKPGSSGDYPICALGTTLGYISGKPVCVPNNQALNKPSQTEFVHVQDPATCTGGGSNPCPKGQSLYCSPATPNGQSRCVCR